MLQIVLSDRIYDIKQLKRITGTEGGPEDKTDF